MGWAGAGRRARAGGGWGEGPSTDKKNPAGVFSFFVFPAVDDATLTLPLLPTPAVAHQGVVDRDVFVPHQFVVMKSGKKVS